MWAPSSSNSQNQRFLLIDDKSEIQRLGISRSPKRLIQSATACIVVFSNNTVHKYTDLERVLWRGLWTQNCAASIQNMLLMATAQGLGSCWISWRDSFDGSRLLYGSTWREMFTDYDIPNGCSIHGMVLLGWPEKTQDGFPLGDDRHGGKSVEDRDLNDFLIRRKR